MCAHARVVNVHVLPLVWLAGWLISDPSSGVAGIPCRTWVFNFYV